MDQIMYDSLLYFPYIDIPKSAWTIKSILYWDRVGIIVPPTYIENPKQYGQFTIDLLQSDLVKQIFPYNYIERVKKFDNGFIKLVTQPNFALEKRQLAFRKNHYSRISVQKFGEKLLRILVELKIAKQEDWQWYYVESKTANLIMLYLATVISKVGGFIPATDDIKNLDTSLSQRGTSWQLNAARQRLIDDLIPYPIEPNLTKLRKFKDKFHEELTSFRILIEQSAFDISVLRSTKQQSDKRKLIVAEINDKKEKILGELKQSRFGQIAFGTICGVTGAIVGFENDNKPLALFSLANAIFSAFQGYDNGEIRGKEYSYIALIDKKLK